MDKLDAMNKDMFDEYVDGNGDGSATIEEIEMVSMNFNARALPKMALQKLSSFYDEAFFDHVFREDIACSV